MMHTKIMLIIPKKKREKVRGQRGIVYCTTLITVTTKVKAKSKLSWTILTSLTKNKHVFAIIHNSKLTGWTMRINDHNWSLKHHLDTKQENNDMCISAHDNQAPELQDLHSVSTQQRLDTVVLFVKSPCLWALVWSSKLDYQKKTSHKSDCFLWRVWASSQAAYKEKHWMKLAFEDTSR
jgi:hypothetical protein